MRGLWVFIYLIVLLIPNPSFGCWDGPPLIYTGVFSTNWEASSIYDSMFGDGLWVQQKLGALDYSGFFWVFPCDPYSNWNTEMIIRTMDGATLTVLSGHGEDSKIVYLEFYTTKQRALDSAATQGLEVYDEALGNWQTAECLIAPHYGKWALGVKPNGVESLMWNNSVNYAEHMCAFFIMCDGADIGRYWQNYCGIYGSAGFSGSFNDPTAKPDVESFWRRLFCDEVYENASNEETYLDNFHYAADGHPLCSGSDLTMIDAWFPSSYSEIQKSVIKPDPCESCGGSLYNDFHRIDISPTVLRWEYTSPEFIDYFRVYGLDAHCRNPEFFAVLPAAEGEQAYAASLNPLSDYEFYEVVAFMGEVAVKRTFPIKVAANLESVTGNGVYPFGGFSTQSPLYHIEECGLVAVGADNAMVMAVVDEYDQNFGVSYLANSAITAADIVGFYGDVVASNSPQNSSPTLILVGPMGEWPTCVPSRMYSDVGGVCFNTDPLTGDEVCYSDYLLTDWNDDGVPNGPVTRMIGRDYLEIHFGLESSRLFSQGVNLAPFNQVSFFCDDYFGNYEKELVPWESTYRDIEYIPLTPLFFSDVPVDVTDRWEMVADQFNDGVVELVGRGQRSNQDYWMGILITDFNANSPLFTRDQEFVAWLPNCHTGYNYVMADGLWDTDAGTGRLPLHAFFMNGNDGCKARMASLVGSVNGLGANQANVISYYLAYKRSALADQGNSVAEVAYSAVCDMIGDFPLYSGEALSVSVLGGNTLLNHHQASSAGETPMTDGVLEISQISMYGKGARFLFKAPRAGDYTVQVYDVRGRLIWQSKKYISEARVFGMDWAGQGVSGSPVASGVYLVQVQNDALVANGKLTIVK